MKDIDASLPAGMVSPVRTKAERVAYLDGMARALMDAYRLLVDAEGSWQAVSDVMVKLQGSSYKAADMAVELHNHRRRKVGGGRR